MASFRKRGERMRDAAKVALTRYPRLYRAARRPYASLRFLARHPHDPDYAAFAFFTSRHGVFLDVGANAGMSALSFRIYDRTRPIVSVEPNPYHVHDLRFVQRLAKPMTFHTIAAGARQETLELFVPVFRGVPLTAEASVVRENVYRSPSLRAQLGERMDSSDFDVRPVSVPAYPLDELRLEPALVKIDVQGTEMNVLAGMRQTVARCRPVLMIETPGEDVRRFLSVLGYTAFTYDRASARLQPERRPALNTFFVSEADAQRFT